MARVAAAPSRGARHFCGRHATAGRGSVARVLISALKVCGAGLPRVGASLSPGPPEAAYGFPSVRLTPRRASDAGWPRACERLRARTSMPPVAAAWAHGQKKQKCGAAGGPGPPGRPRPGAGRRPPGAARAAQAGRPCLTSPEPCDGSKHAALETPARLRRAARPGLAATCHLGRGCRSRAGRGARSATRRPRGSSLRGARRRRAGGRRGTRCARGSGASR